MNHLLDQLSMKSHKLTVEEVKRQVGGALLSLALRWAGDDSQL